MSFLSWSVQDGKTLDVARETRIFSNSVAAAMGTTTSSCVCYCSRIMAIHFWTSYLILFQEVSCFCCEHSYREWQSLESFIPSATAIFVRPPLRLLILSRFSFLSFSSSASCPQRFRSTRSTLLSASDTAQ